MKSDSTCRLDSDLPHHDVYVRIGVSQIHGIGVIAIRDIPEGTNIFRTDELPVVWVDKAQVDGLDLNEPTMKLYRDFCIEKNGKYGCPENFNMLTPGWFLNEPVSGAEPNARVGDKYDFFAVREILKGEEVTVDYSTFSDNSSYRRGTASR